MAEEGKNGTPDHATKRTAAARVLALLDAFSGGGGSLTLTEISRSADLSLTTTHRLVREVLDWGGLDVDDTGHYRLSRKVLALASSSTAAMHLRERALPHLVALHRRTGVTVHLAVRDGGTTMYLEALRAHPNYTGKNRIGGRLELHVAATGLVLLAHADAEFVEDYLRRPLKRYTPETLADAAELRRYLPHVRSRGFAVAERSLAPGASSVAAPVCGVDGAVEAAVGLVFPNHHQKPNEFAEPVRATAHRISRALRERAPLDRRTVEFNRRSAGLL